MKKLISLEMPETMILQLKRLAKDNSISMSAQIRLIIKEYIETCLQKDQNVG